MIVKNMFPPNDSTFCETLLSPKPWMSLTLKVRAKHVWLGLHKIDVFDITID